MLRVAIEQTNARMQLAAPVYCPDRPDQVLLRTGYRLTDAVIDRLRKMHVPHVWIACPGLGDLCRHLNPEVLQQRGELARRVQQAFEVAQNQAVARLDYHTYRQTIAGLVEKLLSHPASIVALDELAANNTTLMGHSLRVSYLAVLLGLKLDAYLVKQRWRLSPRRAKDVTNLGLGAMLHDIGRVAMHRRPGAWPEPHPLEELADPATLANPNGDGEARDWRHHVVLGAKMIHQRVDPTAHAVVAHHHQHYDGSGFPQLSNGRNASAPAGDHIHIYPRIACVADVYDRLRHPGGDRESSAVAALGAMLQPPLIDWFDPKVLGALIEAVPPYPPGTAVTLSDGRRAAIVRHQPPTPCRPVVQIIDANAAGEPVTLDPAEAAAAAGEPVTLDPAEDGAAASEPVTLDLAEDGAPTIAEADGCDVSDLNFNLPAHWGDPRIATAAHAWA